MKILIVSSEPLNPADTLGSTFEVSQAKLLAGLYEVAILSVGDTDPIRGRLKGLLRKTLGSPSLSTLSELLLAIADLAKHAFTVRDVRTHVIEGIDVYEGIVSRLTGATTFEADLRGWLAAAQAGFSKYRAANGLPDLVHAHGRFLKAGVFALETFKSVGVPYVYTEHSSFFQRGWAPKAARPLLAEVIDRAAVYSAVSRFLARSVEVFLETAVRSPTIVPNVVDAIFEEEPIGPPVVPPFTFIQVASLDPNKGGDILLHAFAEAFAANPAYGLTICGDGPLRSELEDLARTLGIAAVVRFEGKLSKEDVLRQIDNAHVLVLSSRIETFGVVLIEALARGRPVIATRCGGPEDIVDDSCGLLVESENVPQLAEALRQMVRDYGSYAQDRIRENALRKYAAAAFLSRAKAMYERALAGNSGATPA